VNQDQPLPARGSRLELEIADLAFGGRGVARSGRFVIFVAGALPGERVVARIDRVRKGYAEASLIDILERSSERTEPRCRYYGECGGCVLQHHERTGQAIWKRRQIRALLQRIARIEDPPVEESIIAGETWRYRMRIDLDWRREGRNGVALGLHQAVDPATIVPIEECDLVSEPVNRIAAWLPRAAGSRGLQAWDPRRRTGLLRRTSLQEAPGSGEIVVTMETGRGDPPALGELAADLVRRFPRVVGVIRHELDRGGAPVEDSILIGRDHVNVEVEGDRLQVPAGGFFQPNRSGSARLRQEVVRSALPLSGASVLELFCGAGFLSLSLAREAEEVVGVEGSRESLAAARANAARAALGNCRFIHQEAGAALPELLQRRWDVVVLDPPRVGLTFDVARALATGAAPRLVYVSCDPATLARDLRILLVEGSYRLDSVVPIDLFPHTQHVECVARLSRG
jgi:23S rRNA (uracil1939-C5)-methyltransferase